MAPFPDYEDRKTAFGDRLIAAAEKVIPGLSSHIVYRTDASPVTYARYDLTSAGSIYGMSKPARLKGAKSPVPGLIIAGSATHGAGVEAAVISGACAANALVPGLLCAAGGEDTAQHAAHRRTFRTCGGEFTFAGLAAHNLDFERTAGIIRRRRCSSTAHRTP